MVTADWRSLPVRLRSAFGGEQRAVRRRRRRDRLPYRTFRGGEAVASALPGHAANLLAMAAATSLALVQPHRFDGLRDNLHHVRPDLSGAPFERLVRRNVRNLARSWVEVLRMRAHAGEIQSRLAVQHLERYYAILERGKGAVVVSMHFGAWEMGLASWSSQGHSVGLLAEQLRPAELFERIVGTRERLGMEVIPIDVATMRTADATTARRIGATATREVYRRLRANGSVAMALDRDIIGNGRMLPFFGTPAHFPVGIIEIGIRTGAGMVPVIMHRDGPRCEGAVYPEIPYDRSAPLDAEVDRVAGEFLALFERLIGGHPDQWNVLEPVWPQVSAP